MVFTVTMVIVWDNMGSVLDGDSKWLYLFFYHNILFFVFTDIGIYKFIYASSQRVPQHSLNFFVIRSFH